MASNPPLLQGSFVLQSKPSSHIRCATRIPWTATLLLVLVCLISRTLAFAPEITFTGEDAADPIETLVIDPRIPVQEENGQWLFLSQEEIDLRRIKKRSPAGNDNKGKEDATTTFSIAVPTTTTVPSSPLPSPFDGGLSVNFTVEDGQRKCPTFINSFLGDPTFKQCYPFSLLLQVCWTTWESNYLDG